ncbi:MAG TPA: tripartite tricarboxylate transporter TctB family protein [Usitatibacter sp.]|jgi:hypothetical protein|nr:tripartite tricarboxylate transporter TctB family protein [Usitatibacter sp.]
MVSRRFLEVLTAVITGSFGTAILASSLAIGVGWTRARGVGPGTFPAIASALIVAGSIYNLVRGALHAGPGVLDAPQLNRIAALFVPALGFVALIPLLGLHIAAGAYVFFVLWRRRLPMWKTLAIAVATPFALYSIFDWTFQVQLLRGLLGNAMGF